MKLAITRLLALCMVVAFAVNADPLPQEDVDRARAMYETVQQQLGTGDAIRRNAIDPLTSDKKMTTFDGSREFHANLMCVGANTFADFTITPMSNGNLRIANIRQDTDMDGVIDSYQTPNWEASAICANGYMYCSDQDDPSTCKSYEWTARKEDYLVTPVQTAMSRLGGCYCINNACGSNLVVNNLNTVMRDIGAGIAGALAQAHPFFALTSMEVDGVYAKLKGADGLNCDASSAESILGTEEASSIIDADYVRNPTQLETDGYEASGNNPLYEMLTNAADDSGYERRSCTITRILDEDKVQMRDIIGFDSGTGGLYEMSANKMRIILGQVGDNYWKGSCSYYTLQSNFYVYRPERIKKAVIKRAKWDDWIQLHLVTDGKYNHIWNGPYGNWTDPFAGVPGRCELKTDWDRNNINVDFTNSFTKTGPVQFRVRVEVSGEGEGYVMGEIEVDTSCKVPPEKIVDNCQIYENNNSCTLLEEEVDGVTTFTNGFGTGLFPMPQQVGPLCGNMYSRDWMQKKRTYRCDADYSYNFDEAFERMEYVKEHSTLDQWADRRLDPDTGEVTYGSGDFVHYDGLGAQPCTQTCKTRRARVMNDMTLSGPTGAMQEEPTAFDFFYHQCTGDDASICPAGPDEEIIKACQCINEFSEATAIMQALRLAGQDMICTDGTKRMPDGSPVGE